MQLAFKRSAQVVLVVVLAMFAFVAASFTNRSYASITNMSVGGTAINPSNNYSGEGYSWNAANSTLTFTNYVCDITSRGIDIRSDSNGTDAVTICIKGSNSLRSTASEGVIHLEGINATFTGDDEAFMGLYSNRYNVTNNYTMGIDLENGSVATFKKGSYFVYAYGPSARGIGSFTSSNKGSISIEGAEFRVSVIETIADVTAYDFYNLGKINIDKSGVFIAVAKNANNSSNAKVSDTMPTYPAGTDVVKYAKGTFDKFTTENEIRCTVLTGNTRIYGSNRYDTSLKVARALDNAKGSYATTGLVIASGDNYPDALAGGYLAKVKDAPLILVNSKNEQKILDYVKDNGYLDIYILGGTNAVSADFQEGVEDIVGEDGQVKRLAGDNRYDTNLAILRECELDDTDLLICSGSSYADCLSASATGLPIMIVKGDTLTDDQEYYISDEIGGGDVYFIGGTAAVSQAQMDNFIDEFGGWYEHFGYSIERIYGQTRYETSYEVACEFFDGYHARVVLAYAKNFPDGLSGGPLACEYNAPMLLVDSTHYDWARKYVTSHSSYRTIVLGGPTLISDEAVAAITKI